MRRSQFIIGPGVGVAASVLTACTTCGKKPEGLGDSTTAPTSRASEGAIAKTADVPIGSGVIVGEIVITHPAAGDFKGFSATCTHAGCSLNEVTNGTIDCPCHGGKFNLDGSVANGPATKPLTSEAVSVRGDSIVLG